ncbi:MAG: NAD(P)/FAD-dependent oxidoreductase [Chloroflexota bacterium]|nr:NAD(P)/FAD-dependent oxidoreductase [Chloroflexota bacterium]
MVSTAPAARTPTVLVVGGGFGGLYAARALARHEVRVVLVDRDNYHLFQPLLYQVATAALSPGDIAEPLRAILRKHRNVQVLLGDVAALDVERRRVSLVDGAQLAYDYLVLATGARHSYFGHAEWEALAPGLKSLADALEIRRRIFLAFELAERETDPGRRRALLTFVIVGGGPTGVELAGAIAEIARHTLSRDFRSFDPRETRVMVIEGGPRVLGTYPPDLSARAQRALERLGVEVRTRTVATEITADFVRVADETILTHTALWAAGVASSPLGRQLGVEVDRAGRVPVQADLSVPGHPEVYVVGDLAAFKKADGTMLPGIAPVAIEAGKHAAHNIARSIRSLPSEPFHYFDRGTMATIGRAAAVADIRGLHLWGFPAWMAWLVVHIFFLIGFENRLLVIIQWAYSYLSYERGARLITGPWYVGAQGAMSGSGRDTRTGLDVRP